MTILSFLRAAMARLVKAASIPGDREALDAHLASSVDVIDAESRMRDWDQRQRRINHPF